MPFRSSIDRVNVLHCCALLAALAGAPPAHAQLTRPDGNWYGALGLGASWTQGKTDTSSFNVTGDAARATEEEKYTLTGRFLRTSNAPPNAASALARQWLLGARRDHNISFDGFTFIMGEFAENQQIDLRLRQTYGVGIGRHLVREENRLFDGFIGAGYTKNDYYLGKDDDIVEMQLGEEFNTRIGASTTFKQRFVVFPSLRNGRDYRWTLDASLVTALVGSWNLQLTLAQRYSTIVPVGNPRREGLFLVSLARTFGPR